MYKKILKTIFSKSKLDFIFVFLAVFLSIFSYMLENNVVYSVNNFLSNQIKPIVGGDIVLSNRYDLNEKEFYKKYSNDFDIAKTISLNTTIFSKKNNPNLFKITYYNKNFPFYNKIEFKINNNSGTLFVDKNTYVSFGNTLHIFGKDYPVKGIIEKSIFGDFNNYSNENEIYLPIEYFNNSLDSSNSLLVYKYYLKFKSNYNENYKEIFKNDTNLKDFQIVTLNDRNDNISNITDRFYVFINFLNLTIFALSFFIIILALEIFFKRIKSTFGILNIFGLKKYKIFGIILFIFICIFFLSFLLSVILNICVIHIISLHYDFFSLYKDSIFKGIYATLILLFVGSFTPFYKIKKSSMLSLLKDDDDFSNFKIKDYLVYLGLIFSGFFLLNLISHISFLASIIYSFVFIGIIIFFYFIIKMLLLLFAKKLKFKNFYLFDSIRSTIKPGNVSFLIIFSGIISFISIFVFYVFSSSFLNYLKGYTYKSNDTFIINIQEKDLNKIGKHFEKENIYEIIPLKIKKINNLEFKKYLGVKTVPLELQREFFTTTNNLNNTIIKGETLKSSGISVDSEMKKKLGLHLGDMITFDSAGIEKTLKVTSFREAKRNGTTLFFYFNIFKDDFIKFPKNYVVTYNSNDYKDNFQKQLYNEIGYHITFVNIKELTDIILGITKKILFIVYASLFYVFILSFLSFMVSILFLSIFKVNKIKTLNILGGNLKKLTGAFIFEFSYLMIISLLFSILFGIIFLLIIFYFVNYFSLDIIYLFYGTGIIVLPLSLMIIYLLIRNKFIKF